MGRGQRRHRSLAGAGPAASHLRLGGLCSPLTAGAALDLWAPWRPPSAVPHLSALTSSRPRRAALSLSLHPPLHPALPFLLLFYIVLFPSFFFPFYCVHSVLIPSGFLYPFLRFLLFPVFLSFFITPSSYSPVSFLQHGLPTATPKSRKKVGFLGSKRDPQLW